MSVRKRGERYLATVGLGRDRMGVYRRTCRTFDTETEALDYERRVQAQLVLGQWKDTAKITVSAYLDRWIEYMQSRVVPATHHRYSGQVDQVKKALGRHHLGKLTPLHITRFESGLFARGLSATTVRKYRMLLHGALRMAVQWELISRNPCDNLDSIAEDTPEVRWLEASEQAALIAAAEKGRGGRPTRLYVPILLDLATGMRRGELLGLRWGDVDFAAGQVSIRRSLQWTPDGPRFSQGNVGRKKHVRAVTLPETLIPVLASYRKERTGQLRLAGVTSELIFCDQAGQPWDLDGFHSSFDHLRDRAGLPKDIHFHCLRHTHATELLRAGVHPKIVAERLGHSVRMTLERYSHAIPSLQAEAATKTDALLRGLLGE